MLCELAYTRKGRGEPLVLIHGIGHRRAAFDPIFEQLAEHFDVIAVDQPGFGDSSRFRKHVGYTMDNVIKTFEQNFEVWGIKSPHVVGNSLGGAIALELGHRKLVSSVTCLSPAGFYRLHGLIPAGAGLLPLKFGSCAPPTVLENLSRLRLGRFMIGLPLYAHPSRYTAERTYGDAMKIRQGKAFWPQFFRLTTYRFRGTVQVPTTIAWGTKDLLLLPTQSRRARREQPLARHVPIHDAGHVPMGDQPEAIIEIISETSARATAITSTPAPAHQDQVLVA